MTLFQTSPKLSAAEEHDYSIRARAGDLHARERLVTANLPFVVLCTKPFRGYGLSDDELVEEGVIGLIEAINRFDADKGYRLTTYAKFWIRHTLFKALNECGATIRLSDDKARKVVKLRKCIAEQRRWQNSRVQMQHICSLVGCSEEEARQLLSLSQLPDSLDMPYPTDDTDCASANTNLSHLADTFTKSIEDSCVEKDLAERIRKAVLSLKQNERNIVFWHYGLNNTKPVTFNQIAIRTGRTKARMQQIEQNAFRHLRDSLKEVL